MDRVKILNKAKIGLMDPATKGRGGCPVFYSSILFSLKFHWDDTRPTAGIDGKNLFINPDWFCLLKDNERIGLLAHEVLHLALRHIDQFELYNRKVYSPEIEFDLWNRAGDYAINYMLVKSRYTLPPGGLYDNRFAGMATFQIYHILHDEVDPVTWVPDDGDIIFPEPGTNDPQKQNRLQKDITQILLKAQLNAELSSEGNVPGEIVRILNKMVYTRLPFEIILANYMTNYAKDDYSYRKPNRRYMPEFYLPGHYSDRLCNIACAFDVSGSVEEVQLASFRNGLRIIQEELQPEKITFIEFDYTINSEMVIDSTSQVMDIQFHGGGGTLIKPVLEWIAHNKPEVTLIFTDGEFNQKDEWYDNITTDIVWLIEGNTNWVAKKGKVIHYEIQHE